MNQSRAFIIPFVCTLVARFRPRCPAILEIGTGGSNLLESIANMYIKRFPGRPLDAITIDPSNEDRCEQPVPGVTVRHRKMTSFQYITKGPWDDRAKPDVVLVDGCHTYKVVTWEIRQLRKFASEQHWLFHDTLPPFGREDSNEYPDDEYPGNEAYQVPGRKGVRSAIEDMFGADVGVELGPELNPHGLYYVHLK